MYPGALPRSGVDMYLSIIQATCIKQLNAGETLCSEEEILFPIPGTVKSIIQFGLTCGEVRRLGTRSIVA